MTSASLCSIPIGKSGIIQEILADESIRKRFFAMGLRAGREARVVRLARLGGPIQIRIGSVSLILRLRDAACIMVLPIG